MLDDGLELNFYGTVKNDNLVFIGLNLTYFFSLTKDPTVERLLSHAMALPADQLPVREIVPLEVEILNQQITVTSPRGEVNTTLAFHENFESSQAISSRNHLTVVEEGVTSITLRYPYLKEGLAVSAAGVILLLLLLRKKGDETCP